MKRPYIKLRRPNIKEIRMSVRINKEQDAKLDVLAKQLTKQNKELYSKSDVLRMFIDNLS